MVGDYELLEEAVRQRGVSQNDWEEWCDYGIAEDIQDFVKRWVKRLGGNRLAAGSVLTEICVEMIESFKAGRVRAFDEIDDLR